MQSIEKLAHSGALKATQLAVILDMQVKFQTRFSNLLVSSPACSNRAICQFKLELYRKCIKDCDEALQLDSTYAPAYLRKGVALEAMGKTIESQSVYQMGLRLGVGDIDVMLALLRASKGLELAATAQKSNSDGNTTPIAKTAVQIDEELLRSGGLEQKQVEALAEVAARGMVQHTSGDTAIDQRIAYGNLLVNTGKLPQAIKSFTELLELHPNTLAALLGRGTALALQGSFVESRADLTAALKVAPSNVDALKRRAQVSAALGLDEEALEDLEKCVKLDMSADSHHQRGVSYYKLRNYKRALADFQSSARLDHGNKITYNYMGQCHICLGEGARAIECYRKALALDPTFQDAEANMGQAYKEMADENKALEHLTVALKENSYTHGFYLRGWTYFSMGLHKHAYNDFTQALKCDRNFFEGWWMRGVTSSGLGMVNSAVSDFDAALALRPEHPAWYQRQLALFYHHHLDTPLASFNIDAALSTELKEAWCKRNPPTSHLPKQPGLQKSILDVNLNPSASPWLHTADMSSLIDFASKVGKWVHQDSPGFLKNRRQIAMAGFAAIEVAQALRQAWGKPTKTTPAKTATTPLHKGKGANGNSKGKTTTPQTTPTEASSTTAKVDGKSSSKERGAHAFGWRDMYDITVKWRQYSEPNDPVWWVDLLTKEAFSEGFGSHTPIITGQCKVIRYGRMLERSLPIFKKLVKDQCALSDDAKKQVDDATTPEDLYCLLNRDYFVVTPCHSSAVPGKVMEGTRLTIQRSPPEGFEYSIRTPGTPPRWVDYDVELTHMFELLTIDAKKLFAESEKSDHSASADIVALKERITQHILTIAFYWYNFMPLARGTAACGYVSILGMFLATGTHLQAKIPSNTMLDWDAILLPTPSEFTDTCKEWMLPHREPLNEATFESLPSVSGSIPTLRHLFTVLNAICQQ